MRFLRQSTASQEILLGPFVAAADGTPQTGLTIANTDIKLLPGGATSESNKNSGGGTHIAGGRYSAVLDATDTATVGILEVSVNPASGIPWNKTYQVVEEAVFDALFAASALGYVANAPVSVAQFGGVNGTFASGRPEVNTSHAAGTAWGSGAITPGSIASDAITAAKIATGAITAAKFAAGAIDAAAIADNAIDAGAIASNAITAAKIASDAITAAKIADGAIDAATFAAGAINAAAIAADAITAAKVAADVTTEIQSGLATAANLATVAGYLDTEIAAILADTSELQTDWANGGRLDLILDARASQTSVDDLPTNAELATALGTADDAVLAQVALVKAVTDKLDDTLEDDAGTYRFTANALEQAPSGGGGLTVQDIVDGVWDEPMASHADSGSTGEALAAAGGAGDPWITALPGAYSAGQAGYIVGTNLNATVGSRATQTSVDTVDDLLDTELPALTTAVADLPTNAELATALGTADDAVLAAIAALNNLSSAQAQTAAAAALTAYDPPTRAEATSDANSILTAVADVPTNAELATALASADDAVLAAIAALNNLSQANIRTAVGLASANLDTQLADLPTNSELATALGTADDAVLAAIAALNNLSSAQAQSAAAAALTAYDPPTRAEATSDANSILTAVDDLPTNAELATALAGADDAVLAAIAALNNVSVSSILNATIEGATTLVQSIRLANAALGGKASGLETTEATYRDLADTKDRIVATVDESGNRTSVTRDLS